MMTNVNIRGSELEGGTKPRNYETTKLNDHKEEDGLADKTIAPF